MKIKKLKIECNCKNTLEISNLDFDNIQCADIVMSGNKIKSFILTCSVCKRKMQVCKL